MWFRSICYACRVCEYCHYNALLSIILVHNGTPDIDLSRTIHEGWVGVGWGWGVEQVGSRRDALHFFSQAYEDGQHADLLIALRHVTTMAATTFAVIGATTDPSPTEQRDLCKCRNSIRTDTIIWHRRRQEWGYYIFTPPPPPHTKVKTKSICHLRISASGSKYLFPFFVCETLFWP